MTKRFPLVRQWRTLEVRFIETPIFTRTIGRLLDEDGYRALQLALALRPDQGSLIRHGGGPRKMRWRSKGRGKRGSIRVIYHWDARSGAFYMLYAYRKPSQDDLTPDQLLILGRLVREEFE